jgi:hypothetical protein
MGVLGETVRDVAVVVDPTRAQPPSIDTSGATSS